MSAKKKKNWFETLCTMDDPCGTQKTNKNERGRVRVSNRAAQYPEDDFPPFDDTPVEPVNDPVPGGAREKSKKSEAAPKSTKGTQSKAKRKTATKTKKEEKPLPAELAYRMQPYLVLFFGGLLAITLFLSFVMSSGAYDWTAQTHPLGLFGYHIERILFGLIGYGTYLLPAAMICLALMRISRASDETRSGRGLLCMGIVFLIPTMIHTCMISAGAAQGALEVWSIKELWTLGTARLGGGVLCGLLGHVCYVAFRTIGTVLIGTVLLLVLLMLLFGFTPKSVYVAIKQWRTARTERVSAYRESEQRAKEASARRSQTEEAFDEADTSRALPAPRKRQNKKEPPEDEQIERPVRKAMRKASVDAFEDEEDDRADYLDPTQALLTGRKKRVRDAGKATAGAPETVASFEDFPFDPDETDEWSADKFSMPESSAPIEQVNELSRDEVEEMERIFAANNTVAHTMTDEEEAQESEQDEKLVAYPDRAEIDLSHEDGQVSPLETPIDDEPLEQLKDVQDGFDYSMESAENADVVEGTEIIGGVAVKVDRLSDEERERGEKIAKPEEELPKRKPYVYPTVDLLNPPKPHSAAKEQEIRAKMQKLQNTLVNFRVRVEGMSYVCGPAVTRYEVRPAPGVRVRAIANLADDIAMSLAAKSIRIEAPIPGKEAVGIEVPNTTRETVYLRRLIDSEDFRGRPSKLTACLGEDVAGNPIVIDLVKMPHLLVAGTTGSGKSVCINDFIMSLVYKSTPDEVKIILIDPKQVEFTVYKDMPHLMAPIVCDPKRAAAALNLAVLEMEKRFQMIRDVGVRDIAGYNAITENDRYEHPYMPQIVIIIDELADLMMQAKDEVETSIVRLAQKARAAGMHLVIGTQRPSVDVITGLIKANVPSRIACTVVSQVDSRTILDTAGAEKLLGMGDMLYAPVGSPKPLRVQGAFVSDKEVEAVVDFIKRKNDPVRYDQEFLDNLDREAQMIGTKRTADMDDDMDGAGADGHDPKFYDALRIAVENNRISTSLLQRMLSIGYGRAAKIIDDMEKLGFVGPAVGNKPREIRITREAYAELIMNKDE